MIYNRLPLTEQISNTEVCSACNREVCLCNYIPVEREVYDIELNSNYPTRTIYVVDSIDGEMLTFDVVFLYDVFRIVTQHWNGYVKLYWQFREIDPYRSFSFYNMGEHVSFRASITYDIGREDFRIASEEDQDTGSEIYTDYSDFTDDLSISSDDTLVMQELDNSDIDDEDLDFSGVTIQMKRSFEEIGANMHELEPFVKVIEDASCLCYQLMKAKTMQEALIALACAMRSLTGRSNIYFIKDLSERFVHDFKDCFMLQSDGHWTSTLADLYENYSKCKDTTLSRRLKAFFNHVIMHVVYHKLNIEVDAEMFDKLEKKKIRPNLLNCLTFIDATLALIVFLLKQGRQVLLTGDIEHLFMDGDSLSLWTKKAKDLKMKSEFLSNPSAIDLDVHTFLSDLDKCIDEAKIHVKYLRATTPEGRFFLTSQSELSAIRNRYLSVTAAQSIRKAPLGIIVFGNPGIGKSSVMTVISDFDARRRGRNTDKAFRYNFSAESEYLDNFRSSMHTMFVDDAAIHNPAKIQGVDPTTSIIMRASSGIGWCPPQAALEDKGKTPMLINLMVVSTNIFDLNLPYYYSASFAAMRRLAYHITPKVRPEFANVDAITLDSFKCEGSTAYPDYWSFDVHLATLVGNMKGEYKFFKTFPDMPHLLQWLGEISDKHDAAQERWLKNNTDYNITLCDGCSNPNDMCLCEVMQVQVYRMTPDGMCYFAEPQDGLPERERREFYDMRDNPRPENKPSAKLEFQQKYCGYEYCDIFGGKNQVVKKWRVLKFKGSQRTFSAAMSKNFKDNFRGSTDPVYLEYYAEEELPILLKDGWSNEQICQDFYDFKEYVMEHDEIEDLMEMAAILVEVEISQRKGLEMSYFWDLIFKFLVSFYFFNSYTRRTVNYFSQFDVLRKIAMRFLRPALMRSANQKHLAVAIGNHIDTMLGGKNSLIVAILAFITIGTASSLVYSTWKRFKPDPKTASQWSEVSPKQEVKLSDEPPLVSIDDEDVMDITELQVLRNFGNIPKPAVGDAHINAWAVEERNVTEADFVPRRANNTTDLDRKLTRNTLKFEVFDKKSDGLYKNEGVLFVISNNCFVTNNHSIPSDQDCKFIVYFGGVKNVSPKVEFLIKQDQIERLPSRDLCFVKTNNLPALFSDISANFVRSSYLGCFDGYYLLKQKDGSVEKRKVFRIKRDHVSRNINGLNFEMEVFTGVAEKPTEYGDCGSPLIIETGYGPIIAGFHTLGKDITNQVWATRFTFEDFKFYSEPMIVQVGILPVEEITLKPGLKSYIDYHEGGNLFYHGELDIFRMRPNHHVRYSEIAKQLFGTTICGHLVEDRLCAPVMDSWRAQQVNLIQFLEPVKYLDETIMIDIKDTWVQYILESLTPDELNLIEPYNIDVAVNGVPGMAYVDAIKKSTSMGYPYFKCKKLFMEPLDNDYWPDGFKFNSEVEGRIEKWLKKLQLGLRLHAIYAANLKDEAVSKKKFEEWKTRMFFSCPAELLIIVRMFYQSFSRVVQRNRSIFWVAVGLNTTSPEWDALFHILAKFGVDTCIAGDHVFYDKKVKMLMLYYVMQGINEVCQASGNYNAVHKVMMEVLKYELMNPSVDFFGMLITLLGGEVSGHQLTTIFNCIMNIFYLMYCWHRAGYKLKEFFTYVIGVILGDDHVLCVSPERPLFHHTFIKSILEGELGLGYTMADKSSESVPYISLYEATFLKRSFVYSKELGVHVGPLEMNSIFKMLTMQVESRSVHVNEQLAQAISSAMSEIFFYGREAFDELENVIKKLSKTQSLQLYLDDYPHLSYEGYVTRFWKSAKNVEAFDASLSQKHQHVVSYCQKQNSTLQSLRRMESHVTLARAFPEICIYRCLELETQECCKGQWRKIAIFHENLSLSKTNEQTNSIPTDIPETEGSSITVEEQTQYINETPSEVLDLGINFDSTANTQITQHHLASYLSRPAKIFTYNWTENAAAGNKASFNPWNLFFNNTIIKNKLEGFALIRSKLKIKITINASQFYYGSIGAFYTPLSGFIKDTTGLTDPYTSGYQVLNSQKPHVWLDPQTTSSAEMTLPFLHFKNWLNSLSLLDFTRMGTIDLVQYAALRSANGVTTAGVNIVVYAWAEDFELTALTSRPVLQSKREYVGNGQISGPMSKISSVASKLKNVPVIGSFASATEIATSAIGSVASIFGFTNVPNVKDVEPVKSVAFHTLASSEISEPINKLSLQPKQEISLDNTYLGDPFADQLHIANFCQRESFLCGSLWTTAYPEDTILFTSTVGPFLYERSTGTNYKVFNTPMSYAAKLFTFWRGDIIFRFKVIRSQYHRGRINICWDAGNTQANNMPGYGNPNVNNIIFDLEETDEVEVRVPYMQAYPFLQMADAPDNAIQRWWDNGTSPTFTGYSGVSNGGIQIRVINRLTAPEASSDVDILVFVRAADNIEFAGPSEINKFTAMALQSKITKVYDFGTSNSDPRVYEEVFGEKIVSFRQLLHRQSRCWTQVISKLLDWAGTQMSFFIPFQRVPRPYGYSANAWEKAVGTIDGLNDYPFNYVRIHPITWITSCFIGYKGSINWTFNVVDNDGKSTRPTMHMSVARKPYLYSGQNKPRAFTNNGATNGGFQMMKNYNTGDNIEQQGATGMALTNQYTQTGLSVNLPYYINSKFIVNDLDDLYSQNAQNQDSVQFDWYEFCLKRGVPSSNTYDMDVLVDIYAGTGPDFDVIFFINCPMLTYLPSPTAAALG